MELLEMLDEARSHMWVAQERLGIKPNINVVINDVFGFNLTNPHTRGTTPPEPYLKCYVAPDRLRRILTREIHWNDAEVACDIMFDRQPNVFTPDVHTLLSFLQMPRPT